MLEVYQGYTWWSLGEQCVLGIKLFYSSPLSLLPGSLTGVHNVHAQHYTFQTILITQTETLSKNCRYSFLEDFFPLEF